MSDTEGAQPRMMFGFWDGGRGHYTRAMTIATEAHERGSAVGIVTSDRYADEIGRLSLADEVYVIPNRPPHKPAPYAMPLYSHALRHAQRQRGLGFDNIPWLRQTTAMEIEAIRHFKPDVVVNDYRDTFRTAAEACRVPIVGVAETTGHPQGYSLGWWEVSDDLILPDCRDSFNQIRSEYDLAPIQDERELFSGDMHLIPSSPSLDPLVEASSVTHYVGRICQWIPEGSNVPYITSEKANRHVYSYVGDPARQEYGYETMLAQIIQQEPDRGFYIAGNSARYAKLGLESRQADGTVVLRDFLPADPLINDSEVVLCHGGQGTVMQALILGKPLIGIGPYHSQMTSIFRPLEEAGAGIMLNHSEGPLERRPAPDLGEGVDMLGYWQTELTAEKIHEAITTVTTTPDYALRAAQLGAELSRLGGVRQAVDLCQSLA